MKIIERKWQKAGGIRMPDKEKIKTTKELMEKIKETQGLDIKKLLTKKGREHEVMSIAVDLLQSEGYEAKLIETKKGYDIETNAPDDEKQKAIKEAAKHLKMMVQSTYQMIKSKIGI